MAATAGRHAGGEAEVAIATISGQPLRPGLQGAGRWAAGLLRLYLEVSQRAPSSRAHRVSSPGLRRYVKAREIPRIKTPRHGDPEYAAGLMTDREARTARWAREVLAWCGRRRTMSRNRQEAVPLPRASPRRSTAQDHGEGPKGEISRTLHEDMLLSLETAPSS